MSKAMTVTASEANRSFSKLLRAVREGKRVTITSHGEPVAVMTPPGENADEDKRKRAWQRLRAHWAETEPVVVEPWSREEIWDEITR